MVNCKLADIGTEKLKETLKFINLQEMASELGIGELTLKDIIDALNKPERDPRDDLSQPLLQKDIIQLKDLKPGMKMQGTVRNVVELGLLEDIDVETDGCLHITILDSTIVQYSYHVSS